MKEYSYDIYNKLGRVQGGKITEDTYNETINRKDIKLVQEWETEFKDSILYGKQYRLNSGYTLFIWKEVK